MVYKAYFKQLFKQYKISSVLSLIVSIFLYPVVYIAIIPHEIQYGFSTYVETLEYAIRNINVYVFYLYLIVIIGFTGLLTTMYYQSKVIDFMNGLPMKKTKRKLTEVFFGWIVLFVPMIIGHMIVYLCLPNQAAFCYGVNAILILSRLNLFYFISMFIFSLCSSIKEAVVNMSGVMIILFLLPIALSNLVLYATINVHIYDYLIEKSSNLFIWLINFVRSIAYYDFMSISRVSHDVLIFNSITSIVIQFLISIGVCALIWYVAKYKKGENAGGSKKNKILYYSCIGLMGFIILCLYSSPYISKEILYLSMIFGFCIVTLIFEVSFENIMKTLFVLVISFVCFISCRQIIVQTEFFGEYRSYQNIENANKIFVDLGSEVIELDKKEDVSKALTVFSDFQDHLVNKFKKDVNKKRDFSKKYEFISFSYIMNENESTKEYYYDLDSKDVLKFYHLCENHGIEIKKRN